MSEQLTLELFNRQQAWAVMNERLFPFLKTVLQAGGKWVLTVKRQTRTEEQNRLMWPILTAFSDQLLLRVDGEMVKMEPDEWKDVLTAAFYGETVRLARGLNGGVVMLGRRTSKFTKDAFSDWIEFLYATAANRAVTLPEREK